MCHCLDCQRRTGSLFGIAAFFERSAVKLVDDTSKIFTRNSVLGKLVTFHFCPECGSTVFWEPERMPKLIGVAVGAFGDPSSRSRSNRCLQPASTLGLVSRMRVRAFAAMPPSRNG